MKTLLLSAAMAVFAPWASAAILGGGEWFIDEDPGFGQGTSFATPAASTASLSLTVPEETLDPLAPGVHLLGIRLREADGTWGHVLWRAFQKDAVPEQTEAATAEWIVDADPGAGNGGVFPVADGRASATVPTAGLSEGVHLLGIRARDNGGRWGAVVWRPFHVEGPVLAAVEYEILRGETLAFSASVANHLRGANLSLPVRHGKEGLQLESIHRLRVIPVAADGRRGEPVEANFNYLRYADAWLIWHFTEAERADPTISAWSADPDSDRRDNALEMSFVLDPRSPGDPPLVVIDSEAVDGQHRLAFRVPGGGTVGGDGIYRTSDLAYTLRESDNLSSWTDVPGAVIASWSLEALEGEAARLEFLVTANDAPRRFFTLHAKR